MNRREGFTLTELAMALLVAALAVASALVPLSAHMEMRRTAGTQRIMDQIKEAMLGFAQANGRLPCPASGATPSGQINAGAERRDGAGNSCASTLGVVPWVTLGVPETDTWGRRLTYRVSPAFADALPPAGPATYETRLNTTPASSDDQAPPCAPIPAPIRSSFALCSLGDIVVFTRNDSSHSTLTIGSALPAIIISHGRNGYGGFQSSGLRLIGPDDGNGDGVPDQNRDEAANVSGNTQASPGGANPYRQWAFYNRLPTAAASGCSDTGAGLPFCEFDDIILTIPAPLLAAHMISAGRLP